MKIVLLWLRRLVGRDRLERDLDRELRFHIEEETRRLVASGIAEVDARRQALAAFGGIDPIKEAARDVRGTRWLSHVWQDLRYAGRMMRRSPAFTAAAVLSLAIGIGANSAVFSVADALLVRSLPVVSPKQLYFLNRAGYDEPNMIFSYVNLELLRKAAPDATFAAMGSPGQAQAMKDGVAQMVTGQLVTGNWFDALGVKPAAGRLLTPADAPSVGSFPRVVLSYAFWTRAFARDPSVIGATLPINGTPFTVIGVAAEGFDGVEVGLRVSVWMPVTMQQEARFFGNVAMQDADASKPWLPQEGIQWLTVIARVPPSLAPAGFLSRIQPAHQAWVQQFAARFEDPKRRERWRREHIELLPAARGLSSLRDQFGPAVLVLMCTAALVLLTACANLASLLLARSAARAREFALRLSLGASRARLVRQLLTESLALALAGGALGLLVGRWGGQALLQWASAGPNPVPLNLPMDAPFLGFTIALSLITGILFGLAPALRFSRASIGQAMPSGGRVVEGGSRGSRPSWGKTLIVAQMALSLVLLVGAILFLRTFENLMAVDAGFDRTHVVAARFNTRLAGFSPDHLPALYERLLTEARQMPGVSSAALSMAGIAGGSNTISGITVEGQEAMGDRPLREDYVTLDYFATVGMHLSAGRGFLPTDRGKSPTVAVVNQTMARRFFGDANPIGHRFGYGKPATIEIIGVVADSKVDGLRRDVPPMAFYPLSQAPREFVYNLYVRTEGSADAIKAQLAHVIERAEPNLAIREVVTLADISARSVVREQLVSRLTAIFGGLALLVGCLGLFGTVSYSVARRTNEIGVRLALGAAPARVFRLVLVETLVLVAAGGVVGLIALQPGLKFVASLLYGLSPHDATTLVTASLALIVMGGIAGAVPAWRASRVDPLTALRAE